MPALLEPASSIAGDLEMLCAADYPAEEVQWLWPNRIPIGKVTLLVGDPGNGKSLVALDIAARVSKGAPWPDEKVESQETRAESQQMGSGSGLSTLSSRLPGSALILSSEDDIRDTIRPRLDAAGADPHHVFVLPSISDLRHDLTKVRAALDRLPDCRLIVIDPVNSYVGPGDSHFHTIVRRVFEPLARLAAEKRIAVLAVSHLRKHDGAAIQRAAGSMGFVAAARAVWTVCRDPVQADRYLMLQVKNNFVADTAGLAYSITSTNSENGERIAPAINWHVDPVTTSAVEALQPEKNSRGPEPAELSLAMDYVQRELISGPQSAEYMYAGAMGGGFSDRTVRRALVAIGGKARKERPYGFGSWLWYLPGHDFKDPELADKPAKPMEPATAPASPLQRPVAPPAVPDKPLPAPSENLSTSQKNDDSRAETCPLRENTTPPKLVLPQPQPHDQPMLIRWYPPNPTGDTRKLWPERTYALLTQKFNEGRIVPYEHYLAQCKHIRFLKFRSRHSCRKGHFKRVEVDLIKPYSFRHPSRCRAP